MALNWNAEAGGGLMIPLAENLIRLNNHKNISFSREGQIGRFEKTVMGHGTHIENTANIRL